MPTISYALRAHERAWQRLAAPCVERLGPPARTRSSLKRALPWRSIRSWTRTPRCQSFLTRFLRLRRPHQYAQQTAQPTYGMGGALQQCLCKRPQPLGSMSLSSPPPLATSQLKPCRPGKVTPAQRHGGTRLSPP
eukprot:Skav224844  [mRNA]  locus=scaffold3408:361693:362097:+ [translate_table: standard]